MELEKAPYIKDLIPIAVDDYDEIYVVKTDLPFSERNRLIRSSKKSGKIIPVPYVDIAQHQRSAIYISAPSGGGKSSFARHWIEELRRIPKFSNYPVFLFTTTNNDAIDPAYDGLVGFNRVNIEAEDFMALTSSDLENSICLFDDWQVHGDKNIEKKIYMLVNEVLQHGRKQNIQVIVCTHQTTQYHKTRDILFECDTFCLFPTANPNSVVKFLIEKCDIDRKHARNILNLNTRHIVVHKSFPRYIIADDCVILL